MKRREGYAKPHKALRAVMAETLVALGRMDPADECEVRETMARLEEMLVLCERHLHHENEFVHRAIETKRPGASFAYAADHVLHQQAIDSLRALARRRDASLYRRVAGFVAENLEHMEREESEAQALMWELFTDAELAAIEGRIVGSMPPDHAMQFLRWMIPSVGHDERVEFLEGLRHAPAPLREGVMALARTHLRAADFRKLELALDQREPAMLSS
jgi:hypothetical protein